MRKKKRNEQSLSQVIHNLHTLFESSQPGPRAGAQHCLHLADDLSLTAHISSQRFSARPAFGLASTSVFLTASAAHGMPLMTNALCTQRHDEEKQNGYSRFSCAASLQRGATETGESAKEERKSARCGNDGMMGAAAASALHGRNDLHQLPEVRRSLVSRDIGLPTAEGSARLGARDRGQAKQLTSMPVTSRGSGVSYWPASSTFVHKRCQCHISTSHRSTSACYDSLRGEAEGGHSCLRPRRAS